MKLVGKDNNSYIVKYYGALIDDGQLILLMEYLPTSLDLFYPILHQKFLPTQFQLNRFIQRLTKHVSFSFFSSSFQIFFFSLKRSFQH